MIAYLKGTVVEQGIDFVILDVGGVGYEVFVAPNTMRHAAAAGRTVSLHISESTAMYGGGTTLYGFPTRDEKEIFLCLREHVPSTGAKKALEYLDKAAKSLPDFRRAILDGDARILADVFGFTKKTADRLIASLKDKLGAGISGGHAAHPAAAAGFEGSKTRTLQQALDALIALGYKPAESRQTIQTILTESQEKEITVEQIVRKALKQL